MVGRLEQKYQFLIVHELEDREVIEKDSKSKQTMKKYSDENNKAQESSLKAGDIVLLRQKKSNKLSTRFENKKYRILQKKGNSVTIKSQEGKVKVRISRAVKLFLEEKGEDMEGNADDREMDEISMELEGRKGDISL